MRHLFSTSTVPDEQMSLALARVHGRLRRRRNALRGAGAAAITCIVILGLGVGYEQSRPTPAPREVDAMEAAGSPSEVPRPDDDGICGRALAAAGTVDLDLTIQQPVEWSADPTGGGGPQQVVVTVRNEGIGPLTVRTSASVVRVDEEAVIDSEPSAPVRMPVSVTLEPSEAIELPADLPQRSCAGEPLEEGDFTLVPVVQTESPRGEPVVVRGSAITVAHR